MKTFAFIFTAGLIALSGCVKVSPTAPPADTQLYPLHATVTPDNTCTVQALGKTYTSVGQVVGAALPSLTGTLQNDGWHAVGCWVSNPDGSDGSLNITFSGNSFQQPFPTGTFKPTFEPPYGSTDKVVSVTFHASTYNAEMLRTIQTSGGSVVVDSSPTGERTIVVDVTAVKFQM